MVHQWPIWDHIKFQDQHHSQLQILSNIMNLELETDI